jgi:hypothetical protein
MVSKFAGSICHLYRGTSRWCTFNVRRAPVPDWRVFPSALRRLPGIRTTVSTLEYNQSCLRMCMARSLLYERGKNETEVFLRSVPTMGVRSSQFTIPVRTAR